MEWQDLALAVGGGQPHARSVVQPQPLDPLGVHSPTFPLQQRGDPAIAIAAITRCQPDDVSRQPLLIGSWPRRLALRARGRREAA